ncbi:MAG: winged helix-turn-helix transcriptional regulator [Alphaproteobacteria bacterium]|nr:winged helix-turn-helix transcriptional regulator [Alphaproteobacteria bacterium]MBN9498533.1 winged helix-turn-helix transcriptional regulator [Alphaproteobacteria bacterium]
MTAKPARTAKNKGTGKAKQASGLHPMLAAKLWENPCWLSFRVNFVAHHFNQPVYDWVEAVHGLTAPEHVVLYALALKDGITADDIVASTARPKNTLSRGVAGLMQRKMITRRADPKDRRRLILTLTPRGRQMAEITIPALVAHEAAMASSLSPAERRTLKKLLDKVILNQSNWPTIIA